MRARSRTLAAAAIAALTLAGCGGGAEDPAGPTTSATGGTTATAAASQECLPVPGDTLVVLEDDQQLQNSDNVIPALNADAAEEPVLAALDEVSSVLDTQTLIELNNQVDVQRRTSAEVAAEWVDAAGIEAPQSGSGQIVVGAANFSENITLASIYAEVLNDAGYDASVRSIGSRETYLPALLNGEIDVVPEYAATLTEFLNVRENGADAAPVASGDIDETVEALTALGDEAGIVFGQPAAAQDQNAFAVTQAFADEYGVSTLSELAQTCGPVALGGPPECPERPFCQPGLEETYGLEVSEFRSLDAGGPLTKTALRQGEVAVGLVFSSDGELAS